MSTDFVVFLGPARSGKTHELLREYGRVLGGRTGRIDEPIWLAPTPRSAQHIRQQLINGGLAACLHPGVTTFDDLASRILASATPGTRRLTAAMQRELVGRIVRSHMKEGRLEFFAEAARSSGFVDMLVEHIHELTRHGVLPQVFAKTPLPGDARRHAELAAIYADYCKLLAAYRLVDRESALGAARNALAAEAGAAVGRPPIVVVDGFTDWTHTQHELLALLAGRAKQFYIELQTDPEPVSGEAATPRADLFAKTAATLSVLRRKYPDLAVRRFAARTTSWPAGDYLVEHIFHHPPPSAPLPAAVAATLDRLEIIEAANAHDELLQVARRIKRLLMQPAGRSVRPEDVIVVFRSLGDAAGRVREVFARFGIPFSLEAGEPLSAAAVVRTLRALVALACDDWPFRGVVGLVTNNLLTAVTPAARAAADWLVRELQIAQGRSALVERVEELADDESPPHLLSEYAERRIERARAAGPAIRLLASALDELPAENTATAWSEALARMATRLGLPPFDHATKHTPGPSGGDDGQECPSDGRADRAAWQCVVDHFAALGKLDTWLGQAPRTLSRRDALASLDDLARHGTLPRGHGDDGRVRVLSAITARTLSAKHVFLAGMSEQAFPAPEQAGRLGTEAEYRALAPSGGDTRRRKSAPPVSRSQEEMLLFYGVLAGAQESLTISFPALDDKAQRLPASPYVQELRRIVGEEEALQRTCRAQLSPVPPDEALWTSADWRVQAVARALNDRGQAAVLAGLLGHEPSRGVARAIESGLRIVHARAHGDTFGPAEGVFASAAASRRLAARFGPRHLWSPSQWETYVACPFRFLMEQVLQLEPLGDLVLETDYSRRGSRLHDVLAEFHRQRSGAQHAAEPSDEQAAQRFIDSFRSLIDNRMTAAGTGIDAALLELDRRELHKWAADHFRHHLRYQQLWTELGGAFEPMHFELRFGPARRGSPDADDPHSCDDTFTLQLGDERVQVTGRIDRIDVARIGERVLFNVIDYKSGHRSSLTNEHIVSGEHLQLPIYVAAAQVLVFGGAAEPLAAGYWTMSDGFDAKGVLAVPKGGNPGDLSRWNTVQQTVAERVKRIIAAIRRGDFPVSSRDDQCTSHCDFSSLCRIAQVRSLGKTWDAELRAES